MQPQNISVNYGEFAEFTCDVSSEAASHELQLFIGYFKVFPNRQINLNQRELITEVNGRLGSMWILMNNKSIPMFDFFWCRIVYDDFNLHKEDSNLAYIHVAYEECSSYPQQMTPATVLTPLTPTTAQTTSAEALQSTSTSDALYFEPSTNGLISGTITTLL